MKTAGYSQLFPHLGVSETSETGETGETGEASEASERGNVQRRGRPDNQSQQR